MNECYLSCMRRTELKIINLNTLVVSTMILARFLNFESGHNATVACTRKANMTQVSFLDLLHVAFSDLRAGHLPPSSLLTLLISKVIAVCIVAEERVSDPRGA